MLYAYRVPVPRTRARPGAKGGYPNGPVSGAVNDGVRAKGAPQKNSLRKLCEILRQHTHTSFSFSIEGIQGKAVSPWYNYVPGQDTSMTTMRSLTVESH